MSNRFDRAHSVFDSLKAAIRSQRTAFIGRPASFATNEQLSARGLVRSSGQSARRYDGPFELH